MSVAAQHSMLNVIQGVVLTCYFVVKWLLAPVGNEFLQAGQHTGAGLLLLSLGNHFEEHVHVHDLVNVQEESHSLRLAQICYVHLLKLADSLDERLILRTLVCQLDVEDLVALFVSHDRVGIHLFHKLNQVCRYVISFAGLLAPGADQVVSPLVALKLEAVEIVLAELGLVLNVLDDVLLQHLLANHQHFFLIGRHSLRQPLEDFFSAAAHGVLAEPAILVILHLDVFVHDVGPLLQVLQLVVFYLSVAFPTAVVVFGDLRFFLVLSDARLGVAFVLGADQVDDFEDFVLDVIFVNKVQNVVSHCRQVCHLKYTWSFVVVFVEEGDD